MVLKVGSFLNLVEMQIIESYPNLLHERLAIYVLTSPLLVLRPTRIWEPLGVDKTELFEDGLEEADDSGFLCYSLLSLWLCMTFFTLSPFILIYFPIIFLFCNPIFPRCHNKELRHTCLFYILNDIFFSPCNCKISLYVELLLLFFLRSLAQFIYISCLE